MIKCSERPLISICIPTYNRSQYLNKALESYIQCDGFDDEVEIIVSDNASSDETTKVVEQFAAKYQNIKYFRNEENVEDSNFCLALDRAKGIYVKLMNDNLLIEKNGLRLIKDCVRKYISEKTPLFFSNSLLLDKKDTSAVECSSFEKFYLRTSFLVTAIMFFGAWKDDWNNVREKLKYSKLKLTQDDWVYQIVAEKKQCVIITDKYCRSIQIDAQKRTGYNWFEVHVTNYYKILQPYYQQGLVSKKAQRKEKSKYLWELRDPVTAHYIYNILPEWRFDMSNTTNILWKHFKGLPFFYLFMGTLPVWGSIKTILFLVRRSGCIK